MELFHVADQFISVEYRFALRVERVIETSSLYRLKEEIGGDGFLPVNSVTAANFTHATQTLLLQTCFVKEMENCSMRIETGV